MRRSLQPFAGARVCPDVDIVGGPPRQALVGRDVLPSRSARTRPGIVERVTASASNIERIHRRSVHQGSYLSFHFTRPVMYTKRRRRQNQQHEGLAPGERFRRQKLTSNLGGEWDSPWGWVGTNVTDASGITEEHLLATCGFSRKSRHLFCANKYRKHPVKTASPVEVAVSGEEPAKDVVIISDDETPSCSKKYCSKNPNCLNYLAQDRWEDAGMQNCQIVARLGTDNPQRPL